MQLPHFCIVFLLFGRSWCCCWIHERTGVCSQPNLTCMRKHYFSEVPSNKHIVHNWKDFRMSFLSSIFWLFISVLFSWIYALALKRIGWPPVCCGCCFFFVILPMKNVTEIIQRGSTSYFADANMSQIWKERDFTLKSLLKLCVSGFRQTIFHKLSLFCAHLMLNSSRYSVRIMDFMWVINHYCQH